MTLKFNKGNLISLARVMDFYWWNIAYAKFNAKLLPIQLPVQPTVAIQHHNLFPVRNIFRKTPRRSLHNHLDAVQSSCPPSYLSLTPSRRGVPTASRREGRMTII